MKVTLTPAALELVHAAIAAARDAAVDAHRDDEAGRLEHLVSLLDETATVSVEIGERRTGNVEVLVERNPWMVAKIDG